MKLNVEIKPDAVQPLEAVESQYIDLVLDFTSGNKSRAAALLGIDRRTLYRKLAKEREA